MLPDKPIRTGRGTGNKHRASRNVFAPSDPTEKRLNDRVDGYPAGHVLSKQNTCLVDRRGRQQIDQIEGNAINFDCVDVEETIETHIVPRRSLTRQQHLKMFPHEGTREYVDQPARVAEKDDKGNLTGRMIAVTNKLLVNPKFTRENRNLLLVGKPTIDADNLNFKRTTHYTKRTKFDDDANFIRANTAVNHKFAERDYDPDDIIFSPDPVYVEPTLEEQYDFLDSATVDSSIDGTD